MLKGRIKIVQMHTKRCGCIPLSCNQFWPALFARSAAVVIWIQWNSFVNGLCIMAQFVKFSIVLALSLKFCDCKHKSSPLHTSATFCRLFWRCFHPVSPDLCRWDVGNKVSGSFGLTYAVYGHIWDIGRLCSCHQWRSQLGVHHHHVFGCPW